MAQHLDLWRRALPPETLHTTGLSWQVEERTMLELYTIWKLTGVLNMISELDEGLHDIMEEVMDDALEDQGFSVV